MEAKTNLNSAKKDLGNGLWIRDAASDDVEELAEFNCRNLGGEIYATWTREMMANKYDSPEPDRFLVVEDRQTGKIVASIGINPGRMCYRGIELKTARIDIVCTEPEYRGKGLVRALFEQATQEFLEMGVLFDGVIGRPWFYHQFGEYAIARPNEDGLLLGTAGIPPVPDDRRSSYSVRDALPGDLPFCGDLFRRAKARYLLFFPGSDRFLAAETRFPDGAKIIQDGNGENAGFIALHPDGLDDSSLTVTALELLPGNSWLEAKPAVLSFLVQLGHQRAAESGTVFQGIALRTGKGHPFYQVIPEVVQKEMAGFPGYVRILDVAAFLRTIAPVLEDRIAQSVAVGYSGTFRVSFYKKMRGIQLQFTKGRLTGIENCTLEFGEANLTQEMFTQLVFGYKSLDDLRLEYPDCIFNSVEVEILFGILFPKMLSYLAF